MSNSSPLSYGAPETDYKSDVAHSPEIPHSAEKLLLGEFSLSACAKFPGEDEDGLAGWIEVEVCYEEALHASGEDAVSVLGVYIQGKKGLTLWRENIAPSDNDYGVPTPLPLILFKVYFCVNARDIVVQLQADERPA